MSYVFVVNSVQGEKGNTDVAGKLPEVNTDL